MGGLGSSQLIRSGQGPGMMSIKVWGGTRGKTFNIPVSGPWILRRGVRKAASREFEGQE